MCRQCPVNERSRVIPTGIHWLNLHWDYFFTRGCMINNSIILDYSTNSLMVIYFVNCICVGWPARGVSKLYWWSFYRWTEIVEGFELSICQSHDEPPSGYIYLGSHMSSSTTHTSELLLGGQREEGVIWKWLCKHRVCAPSGRGDMARRNFLVFPSSDVYYNSG